MKSLFIYLGPFCDLSCNHCADKQIVGAPLETFVFERFEGTLKSLHEILEIKTVAVTGGEPTLHPFFFDVIELASKLGLRVDLFTNANWSPHLTVSSLKKSGITRLNISLDTIYDLPIHNRLSDVKRIFAIIREAKAIGIQVNVITTVSAENHMHIKEIVNFCYQMDVSHLIQPIDSLSQKLILSSLLPKHLELLQEAVEFWGFRYNQPFRSGLFMDFVYGRDLASSVKCDWGSEMAVLFQGGRLFPCLFLRQKHPGWDIAGMPSDEIKDLLREWNQRDFPRKCMRPICYACLSEL